MSPWRNSADYNFVNYFTPLRGSFCSIDNNGAREIFALYGEKESMSGNNFAYLSPFFPGEGKTGRNCRYT